MILSLAVDPFAQQILVFPSHDVHALNETAYTYSTHEYSPLWSADNSSDPRLSTFAEYEIEPTMLGAIINGLSQTYSSLEPSCSSRTCGYPDFVTLEICSECEDVTDKARQSCVPGFNKNGLHSWMGSIPLKCTYTSSTGFDITPGSLSLGVNSREGLLRFVFARQPWTSIETSKGCGWNASEQ